MSAAPGDGTSAARRGSESHSTPRLLNRSSSSRERGPAFWPRRGPATWGRLSQPRRTARPLRVQATPLEDLEDCSDDECDSEDDSDADSDADSDLDALLDESGARLPGPLRVLAAEGRQSAGVGALEWEPTTWGEVGASLATATRHQASQADNTTSPACTPCRESSARRPPQGCMGNTGARHYTPAGGAVHVHWLP